MKKLRDYLEEMARKDIEGAEEEIKAKDWEEAAKKYIKNAKERDMDEKKIRSGLGSTFRFPADSDVIKVGEIEITKEDAKDFKKAIKKALGPTKKEKKETETKEEPEEKEEKPVERDTIKEAIKKRSEMLGKYF